MKVNKMLIIIFISVVFLIGVGLLYLSKFEIFKSTEKTLLKIENEKTNLTFEIASFMGNATTPSTLKLYEIHGKKKKLSSTIETRGFLLNATIFDTISDKLYLGSFSGNGLVDTLVVDLENKRLLKKNVP